VTAHDVLLGLSLERSAAVHGLDFGVFLAAEEALEEGQLHTSVIWPENYNRTNDLPADTSLVIAFPSEARLTGSRDTERQIDMIVLITEGGDFSLGLALAHRIRGMPG